MTDWLQHDRLFHETSGIPHREPLIWPNDARLALSLVISVEYYEMRPSPGSFIPPNIPGGFGRAPYPDFRAFTQRDYGNRVGVFRVLEALDRFAVPATAAIDANVAVRYPYIVEQCLCRKLDIAGHGHSVTNVISSHMSEVQERAYIASALDTLERVSGSRPIGWHGPENGQSARTPALLAEQGVGYVLDWPNDEQPFLMRTPRGTLTSLAMALELDDVVSMWHRRISGERWRQAVIDAVDQLIADGGSARRHLILNLHPWLVGHPHRIGYLEEVLEAIRQRDGIWLATVSDMAAKARACLDG